MSDEISDAWDCPLPKDEPSYVWGAWGVALDLGINPALVSGQDL